MATDMQFREAYIVYASLSIVKFLLGIEGIGELMESLCHRIPPVTKAEKVPMKF
jgi:hypothetical protein